MTTGPTSVSLAGAVARRLGPGASATAIAEALGETLALGRYPPPTEIAWFHYEPDAD